MNERDIQDRLNDLLDAAMEAATDAAQNENDPDPDPGFEESDLAEHGLGIDSVDTFEDAGLLTGNSGLVLRMTDGSEFQITIVRSR